MNAKKPVASLFAVALIPLLAGVLAVAHVAASDAPSDLGRALAAQEALLVEQPMAAGAHNDLGNLLALDGREREAERAYHRAIELDPAFLPARFNLALLLHQRGDVEEALALYRQILELEPGHAWAHYQLGVAAENADDRRKAIEHYARAFSLDTSLSFAKVNPHIIDNRLVTQSLIRAQSYSNRPGAQVPRQYGNADRVLGFMLDDPEIEEAAAEEMDDAAAPEEASPAPGGRGPGSPAGRPDVDRRSAGEDGGKGQEAGGTAPRALTSRDLDPNARSGQASGERPAGTRRSPSRLIERYRPATPPPAVVTPPPAASGRDAVRIDPPVVDRQDQPTAPERRPGNVRGAPRFIPSARSTGNLELELSPERLAQTAPAGG